MTTITNNTKYDTENENEKIMVIVINAHSLQLWIKYVGWVQ